MYVEIGLFAVFVVLQVGDIWSTNEVLRRTGGYECNRILAALMFTIGTIPALIIAKAVVIGCMWASVYFTPEIYVIYILVLADMFYAWVVSHNILVFRRMKT